MKYMKQHRSIESSSDSGLVGTNVGINRTNGGHYECTSDTSIQIPCIQDSQKTLANNVINGGLVMWAIVLFTEEDSVESVPSHWVNKNNTCAWPKNNIKKHVLRRTIPNRVDFNFYPSRVLKKNIVCLQEARTKLKKTEYTSDLSTSEEINIKKRTINMSKIPDPPLYSPININKDDGHVIIRSPDTEIEINSEQLESISLKLNSKVKRRLYELNTSDEDLSKDSYCSPVQSKIQCSTMDNKKMNKPTTPPTRISKTFESHSLPFDSNSGHSKKYTNQHQTEDNPHLFRQTADKNFEIYQTTSSPFKVTMDSAYNSSEYIINDPRETNFTSTSAVNLQSPPLIIINAGKSHSKMASHTKKAQLNNSYFPTSTSSLNTVAESISAVNFQSAPTIINTTTSHSKTSSQTKKTHLNDTYNTTAAIPSLNAVTESTSDTVKRILKLVLKIRYDIETLAQKQHQMDEVITENVLKMRNGGMDNEENACISNQFDDFECLLPISNEDELIDFENKPFRMNVVNGLKRLTRKTLTSTVRQILRKLFDDKFLKDYSYVGQKKKKIFSSLSSCTIIFETIRKTKQFQNAINSEIETPIKIYLAGAAFRNNCNK